MVADLCKELNNWFDVKRIFGTFTISDGTLAIDGAQDGQYIRICDSVFNDGVYKYPMSDLKNETFDGVIWLLAIPQEVISLSDEIDKWISEYSEEMRSPYQSESFGNYSYTKSSAQGTDGTGITWVDIFSDQLKKWRKL